MRVEQRLREAAGFEQREAQDNCVCSHREQSRVNVGRDDHVVDENGIDADADHDEEALECQGEKALEVIRSDAAPLAVAHRSNRDRRNADSAVNLDHSSVQDDCDQDGHDFEAQADDQRFNGKAEQFTNTHCFHTRSHGVQRRGNVNVCGAVNDSSCARNHGLSDVEYCHHDVKGIGHEVDCNSRFEEPLEEHPSVHVVHIVFLRDHGDQLVTQNEGDDDTGNGDYHAFG